MMQLDEQMLEDIRSEERAKMLERIKQARDNAVPQDAKDYIKGFEDGVQHVCDAVLGEVGT